MQIGKAGIPVSHISQAYPDRVEVRGRDLCGDLMGTVGFTEYFHLLLTGREPTEELGGHAIRRLDLLPYRIARAADLRHAQHGHEQGRKAGDDQVQAGAELHVCAGW